jgi:Protein of unknown function (DUF3341)
MRAVYALYEDGHAAQRAVNSLRAAGLPDAEITVITAQPMEDFEFSHIGRETWIWYFASGGGLFGLLSAAWLTRFTQMDWPINTGNMPIVAWWTNLIVVFELTMLGAIIATVATLIVSAGLGRRRPILYDPEVSSGKILVGVESPGSGREEAVERALLSGPGAQLKTIS